MSIKDGEGEIKTDYSIVVEKKKSQKRRGGAACSRSPICLVVACRSSVD